MIGCSLLDVECQCNSKNSTEILQPCLLEKCTWDETFGTPITVTAPKCSVTDCLIDILRAQASLCNRPHDSYTSVMRITAYVTGVIPVIAVAMRFASRYLGGNPFWWDDWIHFVSAVSSLMAAAQLWFQLTIFKMLCIPLCVIFELNINSGIGKHTWDLTYQHVYDIGRWSKSRNAHTDCVLC